MTGNRTADEVRVAPAAAEDEGASLVERAEMLMEIAMGLLRRPKSPDQLAPAVELYDRALAISPEDEHLLSARITARKGTAFHDLGMGTAATSLAGQRDFTLKGDNRRGPAVRDSLCWPYNVAACGDTLVIADSGNSRVLLRDAAS